MRWVGLIAAMLVSTAATAETVQERVERDGVVMVEPDDAEMAASLPQGAGVIACVSGTGTQAAPNDH